jgi:hypothetical protein
MRVSSAEAGFCYDDLIAKLHAQGHTSFDRQSFRDLCQSENLLDHAHARHPVTIGVRSFMHPIDNLEARCDETLNLVPHFDGRYIRDAADWEGRVLPELREFILRAARANEHLRLVLDAHGLAGGFAHPITAELPGAGGPACARRRNLCRARSRARTAGDPAAARTRHYRRVRSLSLGGKP